MVTTGHKPADGADPLVDHPQHYNEHPSGVECIEIVRHMSFNLGNAIKYIWRASLKGGEDDVQALKKAAWYLNDEIVKREDELNAKSFLEPKIVTMMGFHYILEPTEEFPLGSMCPVHKRVHNSHGWYVCIPDEEIPV